MLKRLLASASLLAALLAAAPASAQFQPTPANPSTQATYRASVVALAPAASATDFLTIAGSATKTVVVKDVECSGIATSAGTADVIGLRRSTANTGGTATTPTAVRMSTSDATATAVVSAYTANPTVGTLVGNVRADKIPLPLAATAGALTKIRWEFGNVPTTRSLVLQGVAQSFSLNGNGASFPAGTSLDCSVEWTEF